MMIKAYMLLKVSSGTEREVCKKISNFDEVLDASIIYGEFDIIAKVIVKELGSLEVFLSENVRSIPSIMLTSTMIVAREYKGRVKRNALKCQSL
ncbi:MAG: Lrp/AsnC ligand binding domain-containing protein [Candidatus Bathyarchaeota archaeon]|nr:Lrp/AsnC ligand binding domain-containing protein [Candidatus Bathyarchaeota archaeon]